MIRRMPGYDGKFTTDYEWPWMVFCPKTIKSFSTWREAFGWSLDYEKQVF